MRGRNVFVIGGGIAGLAVSIACAQRGAAVRLFEQARAFTQIGAGIQISPNGARVLTALNVPVIGMRSNGVILRDGYTGAVVSTLNFTERDFFMLHRADLIDSLLKVAQQAGVEITLGRKLTAVDLSGGQPILTFADGVHESAEIVIGADGIHSPLRNALQSDKNPPFFTGQTAWRAVIPCKQDTPPQAEVFMAAGRHLVTYPLRGGQLRNIVAVQERRTWADAGWDTPDDPAHLGAAFSDFAPIVQTWLTQVKQAYLWGLFRHKPDAPWLRILPKGLVVLIGDAAHPTLPFLAQGANMALEDALTLAKALEKDAYNAWEETRRARCTRIINAAQSNARAYHLRGPSRFIAHSGLRIGGRFIAQGALRRLDWIYNFNA